VILAATARWAAGRRKRLFTWDQKALIQRVTGPRCMWRPTHLPQGVAAAYLVLLAQSNPTVPALWITAAVLSVLAGTGIPITRTTGRCSGPIQGGHQWAAAHGGSTSIWNLEPSCESCNNDQSDRWSWRYAAVQWGPWTLLIYGWRWTRLNALLAWELGTSVKAREAASDD
jgi:5-methylcytosine-specific restriction endonuclease McrA